MNVQETGYNITDLQTDQTTYQESYSYSVSPEPVLELDIATLNAMEGTILFRIQIQKPVYPKAIKPYPVD